MTLKMIGKDWRGYKVRLRKQYYDAYSNDRDRIAACPKGILLIDWKAFVAHTSSDKYKRLRQKARESIKNHNLPHTSSCKGFARLEDEMRCNNDSATPVTRSTVWIQGHRKPNGEPVNDLAREKIDQLNGKDSSTIYGKDDALSQVLGPDPPGHVRGVGYGITTSTLFGVNQCLGMVNDIQEKYQHVLQELSSLRELFTKMGNQEPNDSCLQPLDTLDTPQEQGPSTQRRGNPNVNAIATTFF